MSYLEWYLCLGGIWVGGGVFGWFWLLGIDYVFIFELIIFVWVIGCFDWLVLGIMVIF